MRLLFYSTAIKGAGERLQKIIEALIPEEKREVYRTIGHLAHRLRQPTINSSVAVLLAATEKDLSDILSIRDLFGDLRLIVILPDHESKTIARGHSLRPRFLSTIDSNFSEVAAVLDKMFERERED